MDILQVACTPLAPFGDAPAMGPAHGSGRVGVVPAGPGTTVLRASPCRICAAIVTAAGTGTDSTLFYDHASAGSGTVIASIPATVAAGTLYKFLMPARNGITVVSPADGPAITISFD